MLVLSPSFCVSISARSFSRISFWLLRRNIVGVYGTFTRRHSPECDDSHSTTINHGLKWIHCRLFVRTEGSLKERLWQDGNSLLLDNHYIAASCGAPNFFFLLLTQSLSWTALLSLTFRHCARVVLLTLGLMLFNLLSRFLARISIWRR